MTLTSPSVADGAELPLKYRQAGAELSPAFAWTGGPDSASSFVLIMHDIDAPTGGGTDDVLHWLVWNIPGRARSLPEGMRAAPESEDGTRQISVSGPYYRGPTRPATGPPHHYVIELFALDTVLAVPAAGASPAETRAAVVAAMAGRVRGKGTMVVR
jgi:Raf kinase inhibitor-like YbhB/YbcL family protein